MKVRFFRIAPAYYVVLVVFMGLSWLVRMGEGTPIPPAEGYDSCLRFLSQLFFMHDYLPPLDMTVLWSLAVEAKFYLLAPLYIWAIMYVSPRKRLYITVFSIIAIMGMRITAIILSEQNLQLFEVYFFDIRARFHLSADTLLTGVLCALIWHDEKLRQKISNKLIADILFFLGFTVIGIAVLPNVIFMDHSPVTFFEMAFLPNVLAVGFSLMMLGLLGGCHCHTLFENRVFRFVALISYSLYLTHCLFLPTPVTTATTDIQRTAAVWLEILPRFLLLSTGASIMLYYFVEKPMIIWSKATRREKTDSA